MEIDSKIPDRGKCKINAINHTSISFGKNEDMHELIGKTIEYKIGQHGETFGCKAGGWLWDKRDVTIIYEKIHLPEPKQFNPDFLDI